MDDLKPPRTAPARPELTPQALIRQRDRAQREAAALRENLRKRKQQARPADPPPEPQTPPQTDR